MPAPQHQPTLTVAQRASLLRACHCEERRLLENLEHQQDHNKRTILEAELTMLHSAIRALWVS